jgi:hypothetical protein
MYMSIYGETKKIKHNKQYQYLVIKRGSLNAIKKIHMNEKKPHLIVLKYPPVRLINFYLSICDSMTELGAS